MRWLLMAGLLATGSCLLGCQGKRITFGEVHETPILELDTGSVKLRMPTIAIEDLGKSDEAAER